MQAISIVEMVSSELVVLLIVGVGINTGSTQQQGEITQILLGRYASTVQATLQCSLVQNIVGTLMTVYATIIVFMILSLQLCQLHCSVRIVLVVLL